MPAQQVSDQTVDYFTSLDEDSQRKTLGSLSPEAKQALLAGINARQAKASSPIPPPPAEQDQPGFFKRTARGLGIPTSMEEMKAATPSIPEMVVGPAYTAAKAAYGIGKNAYEQGKTALSEMGESARNIAAGEPILPNLGKAAYAYTKADVNSIPGASAVWNFGEDVGTGNYSGAAGDALATVVQGLLMKGMGGPKASTKLNKLTFAAGGERGAAATALERSLPEIENTVKASGETPKTIGDFQGTVQDTLTRLDQNFNAALTGAKGQIVPVDIANDLKAKAASMPPTAEGQAIAKELNKAAVDYQKPWSLQELNAERMYRNAAGRGFYSKTGSAQMAAMRSSADTMIDQIVADRSRDLLYKELDRQFPGQDFQALKKSQSSLIDLSDQLDKRVEELKGGERAKAGKPAFSKAEMSASAHPGGNIITPRLHGIGKFIPGRGPLSSANSAISSAFGPTPGQLAVHGAILSLPIQMLIKPESAVPPPPSEQ